MIDLEIEDYYQFYDVIFVGNYQIRLRVAESVCNLSQPLGIPGETLIVKIEKTTQNDTNT